MYVLLIIVNMINAEAHVADTYIIQPHESHEMGNMHNSPMSLMKCVLALKDELYHSVVI